MTVHDPAYNAMRAEAEKRRAASATSPEAARAHEQLAALHHDRAGRIAPDAQSA